MASDAWDAEDDRREPRYRSEGSFIRGRRPEPASGGWQIDKRIPLAVVMTILAQSLMIAWWASDVEGRIGVLESATDTLVHEGSPPLQVRITRLEEIAIQNGRLLERLTDAVEDFERRRWRVDYDDERRNDIRGRG